MTAWQLYWLTRLDSIGSALLFSFTLTLIFSVFLLIGWAIYTENSCRDGDNDSQKSQAAKKHFFRSLLIVVVLGVAAMLTPSTKEMAFILVAPKLYDAVSKNKDLQEMPSKVVTLANEWLEELRPEKEEKTK